MVATFVYIEIKPEFVEDFKKISLYNHENSIKEKGCHRFDVLQTNDNPCVFSLYEVFESVEAIEQHKTTEHYKKWAEAVEKFQVKKRSKLSHTMLNEI